MIIIWLIRRVLLFYCIMGSRLSKRRWRWLEYLFTMWLQISQWRENLWDGFFLRNHQSCTGVEDQSHAFPQRFVSFSYTRDLFIWSLAQLLSYVFLHTHPKSDSDVCTYNQSPLCLSVVIATNLVFPFKDMCVVFSSVNEWITIVTSRKLPNVVAYSIRKGLSSVAISKDTCVTSWRTIASHSSSCTITWMNRWLI